MIKIRQKELEDSTGAWTRGRPEENCSLSTAASISFPQDRIKNFLLHMWKRLVWNKIQV